MFYVRWRTGESRRGRIFPGLSREHPAFHHRCVSCNDLLGGVQPVQLVVVGLDMDADDETFVKAQAGRWFNATAALLHAACVASMSDADIETMITELVVDHGPR